MTEAADIGPVEYLIVAFPGNEFRGEIAPALADLVEAGTIRIIDIAFAGKDADGEVAAFSSATSTPTCARASRTSVPPPAACSTKAISWPPPRSRAGLVGRAAGVGERVGEARREGDPGRPRRGLRLRPRPA